MKLFSLDLNNILLRISSQDDLLELLWAIQQTSFENNSIPGQSSQEYVEVDISRKEAAD